MKKEEQAIEKLLEAAIDAELTLRDNPNMNNLKAIMHGIRGTRLGRDMLYLLRNPKPKAEKKAEPKKRTRKKKAD